MIYQLNDFPLANFHGDFPGLIVGGRVFREYPDRNRERPGDFRAARVLFAAELFVPALFGPVVRAISARAATSALLVTPELWDGS